MAEPHVVTALIAKRAELAGQLESAQAKVRRLIIDLDNVDSTLRIFKPDIDLDEIRPKPLPPRYVAYKGEVSRIIFGTLRDVRHPMTTEELTQHVMAERDLNTSDKRLIRTVSKRVNALPTALPEPWRDPVRARSGRTGDVEGSLEVAMTKVL